jgi:hypothetical protein
MSANLHKLVFQYVVHGLRLNRCLRTLTKFRRYPKFWLDTDLELVSEDVSSEVVAMLEEHNTMLLRIEGVR